MGVRLTRRAFLAAAAPALRVAAGGADVPPYSRHLPAYAGPSFSSATVQPTGDLPADTDVVIIAGDPAGYAAAWRLAQSGGIRVALLQDTSSWMPAPAPLPTSVADVTPFVRGHQVCFNQWRDAGCTGWGYAEVLPSFKRLERYEAGANEYRGGDGPLSVMHCWDPHPLHRAFLMAGVSGGFHQDSRHDFNGPRSQSVAGYYQKAIKDDRPYGFDAALLDLAPTRGAVVRVADVQVTRVVFDGRRAVAVEFRQGAAPRTIRAERAVIVASRPVRAAHLLMLSGVGPPDQLRAAGVAVVADRPGVGRNLHDQLRLPLRWQARPPSQSLPASSVTAGFFTVSLVASPPDLQMDFVDPRAAGEPQLGLDITLVRPSSRGEVRLRSADPGDAPLVSLNALATDGDVTALVQGVRLARLVGASPQLDRFRGDEAEASRSAQSTAELQAFAKASAAGRGHLAGTCAMGPAGATDAVVGPRLAVHGVDGLYVLGAAVMPTIVNAPPDAASLMIGDRGGEFVAG